MKLHFKQSLMLCLLLIAGIIKTFAQQDVSYDWAKRIGGSLNDDEANGIATDVNGSVYVVGRIPATAAVTSLLPYTGRKGIFFAKYNATGTLQWAKALGSLGVNNSNRGMGIAVDGSGSVYITGNFSDSLDFDPSANKALLKSNGFNDIFIAKYNTNGDYLWAKAIGGVDFDEGEGIAVDAQGSCYVTGKYTGQVDFDPSGNSAFLIGENSPNATILSSDAFLAKYDNNGNYVWAKALNAQGQECGHGVVVSASGSVYVTGEFGGQMNISTNSGGTITLQSLSQADIFLAKFDIYGNCAWAKALVGASNTITNIGYAVTTDASDNAIITGRFSNTVDFDPSSNVANLTSVGYTDIFLAKYDNAGNYVWAKALGGAAFDCGYAVTVDASNQIYVTGKFNATADFDPSSATANLVSNTGIASLNFGSVFFAKYNTNGNYVWAKAIGSAGIRDNVGYGISVDASKNIYITGYCSGGSVDFNPSSATAYLDSIGYKDIFIAKYIPTTGACSTTKNTSTVTACNNYTWVANNNKTYTNSSTDTLRLTTNLGCDSLVILNLTINHSTTSSTAVSSSGTYVWNNNAYASSGTYTVHLTNAAGCDSAATLVLTVTNPCIPTTSTTNITINRGSSYSFNGGSYSTAGTYTVHLTNVAGCDSAATLVLTVSNPCTPTTSITNDTITYGNTYLFNGASFTTSGTYTAHLTNAAGCDSTAILNLTVIYPPTLNITGASSLCVGSQTTLAANITGGVWKSMNNRATVNSSGVVTGTSKGVAVIKYTLGNQSITKSITIKALPFTPSILYASGTNISSIRSGANFCANRTFTVVGSPLGGVWSATGVASITNAGVVSTGNVVGAGAIQYTYTDSNGCSNFRRIASNIVLCSPKGIGNQESFVNSQWSLYPNPAHSLINLKVETLIGVGSIVITDLYGKQIMQQPLSLGINTIDVSKFAKGMYLVSVITNGERTSKKLVIE